MRASVNALLTCLLLTSTATAADLYRVRVTNPADAERLNRPGLTPIISLLDGYLVLADSKAAEGLTVETGAQLVARDVTLTELALDMRMDRENVGKYPLLFEDGLVRLYRVPVDLISTSRNQIDLIEVTPLPYKIEYVASRRIDPSRFSVGIGLDSLVGLVEQDSLVAWTNRLQAFGSRLTGSDSNLAAQEWTRSKFLSFGYDSVYFDTFTVTRPGMESTGSNVVAVKVGTRHPKRYIVIGGHQDGVANSPAADDNASGTVGTLEIARVLANVETYATLVFIAFDGEEEGLFGSSHYANAAYARGDTIVFTLNMDMIAHYENTYQAKLYSGADSTYVTLWQELADSLAGITGTLTGIATGNSDQYWFIHNGYPALFVQEGVFSTHYHSISDSTTYMSFPYMAKMIKATLATAYVIMLDATIPDFEFIYSPEISTPIRVDSQTTFQLSLLPKNGAVPVSGTGRLNYATSSGPYQQVPLTEFSPTSYEFTLPAVVCSDTLRFFISLEEAFAGLISDRSAGYPYTPNVFTFLSTSFADDFETDKGWTTEILGATTGAWERGIPVNDPNWSYTPPTDADGSGKCYLTQNTMGESDVDHGSVRLTSPAFSLAPSGQISYYFFVTPNIPVNQADRLSVEMNDGQSSTWHEVAYYSWSTLLKWKRETISPDRIVAAGVSLTNNMRIRFTANDGYPESTVEAGIDGFQVITYDCYQGPPYVCGDANGDAAVDIADAVYLITYIFKSGPGPNPERAGDTNCDSAVDIADAVYIITYIFKSGAAPCAACE